MASLALGALGASIGGSIGYAIGVTLAGYLWPTDLGTQDRGKLDDLRVTSSAYGLTIPIVYGRVRIGGNIIWSTDLVEHTSKRREGGCSPIRITIKEYSYTVSMAVALSEGTISGVLRIWAEDILLYDNGLTEATIRIYTGSEDQTADPLIAGIEGADNAPAYRGIAYVVFEDLDLSDWGGRIPNLSFEVLRIF